MPDTVEEPKKNDDPGEIETVEVTDLGKSKEGKEEEEEEDDPGAIETIDSGEE